MIVDNNYNKWNINKLPRVKGAQGATGSTGVVTLNGGNREGTGYPELEAHYLWGQFFNGKQDVNGDITTDGDVNFYGNLNFMGDYDKDDEYHGNLNIRNVNGTQGNFKYLNADLLKAAEAYIDNLTVTGTAHFFELIIDKIKSTGGSIMLTPADGFELWGYSIQTTILGSDNIDLWWVVNDGKNGKYNKWEIGDQAICKNFDKAVIGKSYNISNKNWWAKVVAVNDTGRWCVKLGENKYNPDEITVLPNNDSYYVDVHTYLTKNDFELIDDYVYVYIVPEIIGGETVYHRDQWITKDEYFSLPSRGQQGAGYDGKYREDYEFSQIYVCTKKDGTVLKISQFQYDNTDITQTDILVYDDVARAGRILRSYCKNDCKFCYNITIDISECKTGSEFRFTEDNHTAWVFQEGDNIVMLGNQLNEGRQNAIYLCSGSQGSQGSQGTFGSLDTDLRPPFIAQYKGIGSQGIGETAQDRFNLEKRKLTWFSGGWVGAQGTQGSQGFANNIQGNLRISTGESVEDYVGSEIIAQSDAITMRVKSDISEAGITILDDEIILDADKTTVTGTLQLNDSETGLVIYDNNVPVIAIQNDTVNVTSQYQSMYTNPHVNDTTNYVDFCNYSVSYQFTTHRIVISDSMYNFGPITVRCANEHLGRSYYPISRIELKIDLYTWNNDEYITTVYDGTITPSSASALITIPAQSFTSSYSGGVYLKVTKCKVTFDNSYALDSPEIQVAGYLSTGGSLLTKIGKDGARFTTEGANKYIEFTANNYLLHYNNQEIKMKSGDGNVTGEVLRTIYYNDDTSIATGDIGSITPCRIISDNSGYTLLDSDGFIVYKGNSWSSTPEFIVDNPVTSKGRYFRIKNMTNQNSLIVRYNTGTNVMVNDSDGTISSTIDIQRNACMFICDGEYWYQFFCA